MTEQPRLHASPTRSPRRAARSARRRTSSTPTTLQDSTLLYDDPRVYGPDLAHRRAAPGSLAMVWLVKGFTIAPTYFYRSPLPVSDHHRRGHEPQRREQRHPGARLPVHGRRPGAEGHRRVRDLELRPRRAAHADEPPRLDRLPAGPGSARLEAIGEVFNLLNAKNPASTSSPTRRARCFMQPNAFAGDFQQPEQRVGQIGFRFTF